MYITQQSENDSPYNSYNVPRRKRIFTFHIQVECVNDPIHGNCTENRNHNMIKDTHNKYNMELYYICDYEESAHFVRRNVRSKDRTHPISGRSQ
jgi:hypothetical protein